MKALALGFMLGFFKKKIKVFILICKIIYMHRFVHMSADAHGGKKTGPLELEGQGL